MSNVIQFPETVTIRTPMHMPLLRGVQSRNRGPHAMGALGTNLRVRLSYMDDVMINRVLAETGMKKTEFVRWCTVHVAREMDEYMAELNGHDDESS